MLSLALYAIFVCCILLNTQCCNCTIADAGGALQVKHCLQMPVYPATLQHMPIPMAESVVLSYGRQLKFTLQIVHSKNYGHNDVKAANVFISSTGKQQLIACACFTLFVCALVSKSLPNQHKLDLVNCMRQSCACR